MKYKVLIQISNYLTKFKRIYNIKRVDDRVLMIEFEKKTAIFFDMNKGNSTIYKRDEFMQTKSYKAPFDVVLAKRVNASSLEFAKVLENNRILHIQTSRDGSYKKIVTNLYFEFTGRFTNIIITDEKDTILEALSHYENERRSIKVGRVLEHLEPFNIKEKESPDIENMDEFLRGEFERVNSKKLENAKASKISRLDKRIESLKASLNELQSSEYFLEKSSELNQKGALLTANLHNLKEYERKFELIGFDGEMIKFNLEESPKFEAKKLFDESKKLKQKAHGVKLEFESLNEKLNFNLNLKELVTNSNDLAELEILMPKKAGGKTNSKKEMSDNIESFYIDEFKISVGKNEKGNIALLKESKKDDFWFHLKDIPSSHVIVKTNKQHLRDDIVEFAAKICVNFSVKSSGSYLVDYTKRANVKVVEGAFVNYVNYSTISVLKP
ncbi:MAG: DUF814 domain-containing protein [Campylobacteraceae bacterium]|nr:DUF814 domain-containing protein [Campylobacteraceae bacterium]